jgi:hypothetical protein
VTELVVGLHHEGCLLGLEVVICGLRVESMDRLKIVNRPGKVDGIYHGRSCTVRYIASITGRNVAVPVLLYAGA